VWTGGGYPASSVTSVLAPPVEASYLRLEILLPAASSATAMTALRAEFYGAVTADLQTSPQRTINTSTYTHDISQSINQSINLSIALTQVGKVNGPYSTRERRWGAHLPV